VARIHGTFGPGAIQAVLAGARPDLSVFAGVSLR
jgi:hypothetical protein